ncbi:Amine oxidase, flavin-containing [Acidisarcina polymorpha]|uniref:Tryptophan 2-monooxygenase n=1 Tax=Acidisarcina polymorpha TaxID=2211140 RepID=A0A2Z5G9K2_9BACT|nr:flavin monoamine oxidase family protein [Acidisarcina polymorpha]AXC15245.1 Amine oxidase, flavin-containing [Acidisarcina polymorpha]
MAVTRRAFLTRIGQLGGYGAAFTFMQQLGLLPAMGVTHEQAKLRKVPGNGATVVILGGGIAGLISAYELGRLGYRCTLLEARDRVGGRNWTVRRGVKIEFTDGFTQNCEWEEGNYQNFGPGRLPSIHTTMLGYCRELNIPLEVEVNTSRCTLLQSDKLNGGAAVEQRRMINDTRGHVSELLAKSINKGALDQDLTSEDKERMLTFLREYGDLSHDFLFKGTDRSGFKIPPGAGKEDPTAIDPLPMHALLDADLWQGLLSEDAIDWQATMFQPVGGMDLIPKAFAKQLGDVIRYQADVQKIRHDHEGVTVTYLDCKTGQTVTIKADYCICNIPLPVLQTIDADFAPDVREVIAAGAYDSSSKIAWESRRFWEQDYNIYGGISYLRQPVEIVWYPSARMFTPTGIIVGGYADNESGTPFGDLRTVEAKISASRQAIELLHPGHGKELTRPLYVNWGKIPYALGGWLSDYSGKSIQRLLEPDGRIYFAGDYTSHLSGWQEGAALSAYRSMNQIGIEVEKKRPDPPFSSSAALS